MDRPFDRQGLRVRRLLLHDRSHGGESRYDRRELHSQIRRKRLGRPAGPEKSFTLRAGESALYADVLGSVFGLASGYGAVRIQTANPALAVEAQTSTPGSGGGTFGQSVPGSRAQDLIGVASRSIAAVREDARFRTNLVLANAVDVALDVTVTLLAGSGDVLGMKHYALQPFGMRQVTGVARDMGVAPEVSGARLMLSTATDGGSFADYAAVIDNQTNDPRTLLPQ